MELAFDLWMLFWWSIGTTSLVSLFASVLFLEIAVLLPWDAGAPCENDILTVEVFQWHVVLQIASVMHV